jgi:hypothetical protein
MNESEIPIERLNRFFEKHIFEVFINETGDDDSPVIPLNTKIQFTGVKDYIYTGEKKPTLEYTLYILPTNKNLDKYYGLLAYYFGEEVHVDTKSNAYLAIRWITDHKVEDMLKYFSLDNRAICTKVVNKIKMPIREGLITEGKFDPIVRQVVRDIISVFKHNRKGEFGLPEDLSGGEMTYNFPKLDTEFSIFLDLQLDPNIEGVDVDADYLKDDDLIYITIISNPEAKYSILQELTSELNEIVRHELEHIKQNEEGYEFPKEPKNPQKYYTQQHELEAQRAGFKRRAKGEKKDFETIVRQWFEKNKHKHQMNPKQAEKVIQKILQEK